MALTQAQGLGLSNPWLRSGFYEDIPQVIQLAHRLWFDVVPGDRKRDAIAPVLAPAGGVGYGPPPTPLTQSVPSNREYSFGVLADSFTVNYATQDAQSNVNDQTAMQFGMAVRRLLYGFWRMFIEGDTVNPGEFQGLRSIISQPAFAGQIIDKGGTPLATQDLSSAMRRVKSSDNFSLISYTSAEGYNAVEEAFISRSVLPTPKPMLIPDGFGGFHVDYRSSVFGADLLWSDFVPIVPGPPALSEIWFINLGAVHGICPPLANGQMIRTRATPLGTIEPATRFDLTYPVAINVPRVTDIALIRNFAV